MKTKRAWITLFLSIFVIGWIYTFASLAYHSDEKIRLQAAGEYKPYGERTLETVESPY